MENKILKTSDDELAEALAKLQREMAYNREENLNIARRLDHVGTFAAALGELRQEVAAQREENLNIARRLDQVAEIAVALEELRQEAASQHQENLNVQHRFDHLETLPATLGDLRQALAAHSEENLNIARLLDALQWDFDRLAIALDSPSDTERHDLLHLARGSMRQPLRLAVIGTPRSGNTWLRLMLGRYYHLNERATDLPSEIGELPARAIVQIHWPPTEDLQGVLVSQGIRPVVMARHPLDVLISVLHFIRHEPRTSKWLDGAAMIPPDLIGKNPASPEFQDYCLGEGAANLLAVSSGWWGVPGVIRCCYEDLLEDTETVLRRVRNDIGLRGAIPLAEAAASVPLDDMRALANNHGWQGKSGYWRRLMSSQLAEQIYAKHLKTFEILGYNIEDYQLSEADALANWRAMARDNES